MKVSFINGTIRNIRNKSHTDLSKITEKPQPHQG